MTSYDEIPYQSEPVKGANPAHIETISYLFGMNPAPARRCRVLELGCAAGGNILALAREYPQSNFLGIDLSARQVAAGREAISRENLTNARIDQQSILDVPLTGEPYDYIICHGIYSWVPEPVQAKILQICGACLAPHGVAYVSYNTFPGWHMRLAIREMMLFHVDALLDPNARADSARTMVDFLMASVQSKGAAFNEAFKAELKLAREMPNWYLTHDFLAEHNQPIYFSEFMRRAELHGLQYMGDTEVSMMSTHGLSSETRQRLKQLTTKTIRYEQYLDFVRNRMFRRTLLCHKGVTLQRQIDGAKLSQLAVASALETDAIDDPLGLQVELRFVAKDGGSIVTKDSLLKAALLLLENVFPQRVPFDTLFTQARDRVIAAGKGVSSAELVPEALQRALLTCYLADLLELYRMT